MRRHTLRPVPKPVPEARRYPGELVVYIDRPPDKDSRLAIAASLTGMLERIGPGADFLLISTFRSRCTKVELKKVTAWGIHRKAFFQLVQDLRSLLGGSYFKGYWLMGHWTDAPERGQEPPCPSGFTGSQAQDMLEYSWLLVSDAAGATGVQWLEAALLLTGVYDQPSCIVRVAGQISVQSASGDILSVLADAAATEAEWKRLTVERGRLPQATSASSHSLQDCRPESQPPEISSYVVTGTGDSHAIEFFVTQPDNIASHMFFDAVGIRYRV